MSYLQILVLSAVQGISEFLPISSSGHLILTESWGGQHGWVAQGLAFDIALHIGSAFAVILYFRRDLYSILTDSWKAIQQREHTGSSRLGAGIVFATLPAVVFGLTIKIIGDDTFRSPTVVAIMLIVFALVLGLATLKFKGSRPIESMTVKDYLIIGFAQAIALIPGTSRSGITISAGLFRGLSPDAAARFSFLLSLPAILMAGSYESLSLILSPTASPQLGSMLLGIVLTAIISFLCIHFLMSLIRRFSLIAFVVYRIVLGIYLLMYFV